MFGSDAKESTCNVGDPGSIPRSLYYVMSLFLVFGHTPWPKPILRFRLLLLLSIFPSIRVFPSESVLHIRWPKYWNFSFSISPSSEYPGLISFWLIKMIFPFF